MKPRELQTSTFNMRQLGSNPRSRGKGTKVVLPATAAPRTWPSRLRWSSCWTAGASWSRTQARSGEPGHSGLASGRLGQSPQHPGKGKNIKIRFLQGLLWFFAVLLSPVLGGLDQLIKLYCTVLAVDQHGNIKKREKNLLKDLVFWIHPLLVRVALQKHLKSLYS